MKASALTLLRLLNRLPEPRKASLEHLAHAAAMLARAAHTEGPHDDHLTERLERLQAWLDTATEAYATPPRPKRQRRASVTTLPTPTDTRKAA